MTNIQAVDTAIQERIDQNLEELSRLCAQPSIAAQGLGMEPCAELVKEMLAARGFNVQILPTAGFPVVFAERGGRSNKTLLFYNHYDVQPPEPLELWETPPFEPAIRDGKMYARGVSDDKGHILCRLAAIDAILAVDDELPCNVTFLIEGEEEIGSINLAPFIEDHTDLLAADACLWEFGYVNSEGVPIQYAGLRGICYVELSIRTASRDVHSGTGGSIFPNAAWRLTWALNSLKTPDEQIRIPGFYDKVVPPSERDLQLLEKLPDPADEYKERFGLQGFIKGIEGGQELKREAIFTPTCTICGLTSGYQGPGSKTVLPSEASAKVDFRLIPNQDPQEVLLQLRNHLNNEGYSDIEITFLGGEAPARTDPDDPFLQMVVESAREVYGVPMMIQPMSGGSGPNHAFIHHLNVPVATAGVGYPDSRAHAPNENLVIENFVDGVKHTARILVNFGAD
ncbi:MAG: M20/M25/M40 family metallo-hydrolase [Anaerolineaceae bacterium]|nr:MAG: M20/M25/M40 family metallo-hydrolase [Anaerolineaceae bacterium]